MNVLSTYIESKYNNTISKWINHLIDMEFTTYGPILNPQLVHNLINISTWIWVQRSWSQQ